MNHSKKTVLTILATGVAAVTLTACSGGAPTKSAIAHLFQKQIDHRAALAQGFESMLGGHPKTIKAKVVVDTMSCKAEKGSKIYNCDTVLTISDLNNSKNKPSTGEQKVRVTRHKGKWVVLSE